MACHEVFIHIIKRTKRKLPHMKVFPYIIAAVICAIVAPCLVTFCINGKQGDRMNSLENVSTGRDVLVQTKAGNDLVDVEVYVAHIMPGIVDASADDSYMQAQAVALRTKGYYAMGEATVIQASDLEFQYFTEEDYIAKWGRENYKSVKARYERAVMATSGKIIEAQKEENN